MVEAALDAGVTFFDTADLYGNRSGSERFLGEILEGRRDEAVIATKFGWDIGSDASALRGSAEYVGQAIEASLERLRTDYVDLYYYHRPDGVTPFEETLGAMHELVVAGQGTAHRLLELQRRAAARGVRYQPPDRHHADRRAPERVQPARALGGGGRAPALPRARHRLRPLLPARQRPPHREVPARQVAPPGSRLEGRAERLTDERFDRVEELERFAEARGHTILELAIGALASTPGVVSVIAGATTPEQVRANAAAGSWKLSEDDLAALVELR